MANNMLTIYTSFQTQSKSLSLLRFAWYNSGSPVGFNLGDKNSIIDSRVTLSIITEKSYKIIPTAQLKEKL